MPAPQQRQRHVQRQNFDLLADPEHQRIVSQVDSIAEKQGQTAVILERLTNYFQDHDRRLDKLEEQPANQRATITGYGGLMFQAVSLIIALMALLVAAGTHISLH